MRERKFRLTEKGPNTYSHLEETEAEEIRKELQKALCLMPNFAPAHHLATLQTLCLPNVEPPVRHRAEEILKTVFDQARNR